MAHGWWEGLLEYIFQDQGCWPQGANISLYGPAKNPVCVCVCECVCVHVHWWHVWGAAHYFCDLGPYSVCCELWSSNLANCSRNVANAVL